MKKIFLTLMFVGSFALLDAQNELDINFDSIKSIIENPKSEYYYPNLLNRFNDFDSTLTHPEYALIYYGFSFQEDYIKNKPSETKLGMLAREKDYEAIMEECQKILKKNPVSLKANNEIGYALYKLQKPEQEWRKYQNRYRAIRKVIAYSGNGLRKESAFKVIYVEDEYDMLYNYFHISKIYEQSLVGLCDKFIIEPTDNYQVSEVYFNISRKLFRTNKIISNK